MPTPACWQFCVPYGADLAPLTHPLQGLASIAFTPTCSTSGTPGSRASSILRGRMPATPPSGGALGSPIAASGSPSLGGSSCAAALLAAGGASPLATAAASPLAAIQQPRAAAGLPAAVAAAGVQAAAPAGLHDGAAPLADRTPPTTRRSVRFAGNVLASGSGKGPLRVGTPHSSAAAGPQAGEEEGWRGDRLAAVSASSPASQSASPVVASCPRGAPDRSAAGASPAAHAAAAGQRRSPLAPTQSAVKPAPGGVLAQRLSLGSSNDGSSDDDDSEVG